MNNIPAQNITIKGVVIGWAIILGFCFITGFFSYRAGENNAKREAVKAGAARFYFPQGEAQQKFEWIVPTNR